MKKKVLLKFSKFFPTMLYNPNIFNFSSFLFLFKNTDTIILLRRRRNELEKKYKDIEQGRNTKNKQSRLFYNKKYIRQ